MKEEVAKNVIAQFAAERKNYKQMSQIKVYESDKEVAESIKYKPADVETRRKYRSFEFVVKNS